MRLRVIATDYDGTIASNGVVDSAVREAIKKARKRGVLVVIVTGRILSELRHVAGCLDFVDGVVAENGAVIALPKGHTTLLGRSPPLSLITKLTERGIDFKVGRCVVEMEADFADIAISLIRQLELPLAITFNRGRMMLLPASISKAGGLRALLDTLGVSVHNAVGIGDAENDHELLTCCEHGVAVSWGSSRLKKAAGHVIEGDGPGAVAEYIDRISADIRLPIETTPHRKLILEELDGHTPLEIAVRGRNVLVAGDSKSGKTWLAGLLIEQQILQGYTVYAFDPEGDYSSLATSDNSVRSTEHAVACRPVCFRPAEGSRVLSIAVRYRAGQTLSGLCRVLARQPAAGAGPFAASARSRRYTESRGVAASHFSESGRYGTSTGVGRLRTSETGPCGLLLCPAKQTVAD